MTIEIFRAIRPYRIGRGGSVTTYQAQGYIAGGYFVSVYEDKDLFAVFGVTKECQHEANIRRLRARREALQVHV